MNNDYNVPEHTFRAINDYVSTGQTLGNFLYSLLTKADIFTVISYADDKNTKAIVDICKYVYNNIPIACWGTPEKVSKWIKLGGLEGINKK